MSMFLLILLLLFASMMFFGILSYSLGRKKTTNPKLTGMLGAEESPDDLQINHQIRVEAHLVA
ncbi:MAG: hypothetical protein LRY75_06565 [Shewanella xiamenensis]|nr:hypothetical protein [Shewanella xiamenensis]MCD8558481.1 hypothetical protein [Shewanella xiamenensis]